MTRFFNVVAGIGLMAALSGCSSQLWTRSVVDASSADTGETPALALRETGSSAEMSIAYIDAANSELKLATRSGNSAGWGAFSFDDVSDGSPRLPEIALAPGGTPHIVFVQGASSPNSAGSVWHAVAASSQPAGTLPCSGSDDGWFCQRIAFSGQVVDPVSVLYEERAGLPDILHVAWAQASNDRIIHFRKPLDQEDWSGGNVTDAGDDVLGSQPKLFQLPSSSSVHMAMVDDDSGRVEVRTYSGNDAFGWGQGFKKWLQSGRDLGVFVNDDPSLSAIDALHYAIGDCIDGAVTLRSETGVTGSGGPAKPAPLVEPDAFLSCAPSMAMDTDGFLYVATYRKLLGGLDLFRFNAALDAWPAQFYTIVDNDARDVGLTPRIVHSKVRDELLIVYHDETNGRLKLATRQLN